jgi:hypothetical protein
MLGDCLLAFPAALVPVAQRVVAERVGPSLTCLRTTPLLGLLQPRDNDELEGRRPQCQPATRHFTS